MHRIWILFLLITSLHQNLTAQSPEKWSSSDIHHEIKKLQVLGSALFVAAHPDDENTRMISYLSNERMVNMAYLSLTRGDGGQNLIGTEIKELLGVIRTQELLAARRIDGGNQLFTRANDFGYSKHPDETLKIWEQEKVLSDVVWAIRKWQPDVIINRFDVNRAGKTHGHHTSSAILSQQAFDLAADKNAFPEQLEFVDTWQPKRLYYNTSWWRYGSREKFAEVDKSKMATVDIGVYYPLKGLSNNEIAAYSRSQHKCQGMGNTPRRGSESEFLEVLEGELPTNREDVFSGIDITWNRIKGASGIAKLAKKIDEQFNHEQPVESLPDLMKLYQMIDKLPDGYWKKVKKADLEVILQQVAGLFLEAAADDYSATPSSSVELTMEVINRSDADILLKKVLYLPSNQDTTLNLKLDDNQSNKFYRQLVIDENTPLTNPYWLNKKGSYGMYNVEDQTLIGLPETPQNLAVQFELQIAGKPISIIKPVVYKNTDRVKGEVYRPFEITAPVYANITDEVYVFDEVKTKTVQVVVKAMTDNLDGSVTLAHPNGWSINPQSIPVQMKRKGAEQIVTFELTPPEGQAEGLITPIVQVGEAYYTRALHIIDYDHIPVQMVGLPSESKIVKIDLKKVGDNIGYVMGAGDKIPESLRQIGYNVDLLNDDDLAGKDLKEYDAIIIGIRAYNTNERMKFHQKRLFDYVQNGGTLINQYQTTWGLKIAMDEIAPFPLKISRERVSVEEAPVRILQPNHAIVNFPNKITDGDFENWVQERGLYFANEWDDAFVPILSANDPGEPPRDGGMLVARYGKGYYIYSGYSWFRELPAGVPGAYRLFVNMISIGKEE